MTREEKEQTGKYLLKMARLLEDGCKQQKMLLNAVHIIDEVLEQEPILDKIRADIANHLQIMDICDVKEVNGVIIQSESVNRKVVLYDSVMRIIDKYKAESEEDNGI